MTDKKTLITRIICGIVCGVIILETVGCTDARDTSSSDSDVAESVYVEETEGETERWQTKDSLPDNLDYAGKDFGVLTTASPEYAIYYTGVEEESGDVVEDAVLKRNRNVETRLNIKLQADNFPAYSGDAAGTQLKKLVMSGDTTYSIMIGTQWGIAQVVAEGPFLNAYELEHVDFTQPWWNNNYMDEVAVGNNVRYLLVSDYDIDVLHWSRVIFYNKVMYDNYYGNPDDLYVDVLDGKWTIDYMSELSKGVYMDLNNNGKTDLTDQLGYVTYLTYSSTDSFIYGTDVQFTERDENGFVQLTMLSDRAVTLCEKVVGFFWQDGSSSKCNSDEELHSVFSSGNTLFMGNGSLRHASNLRDMEDDFGFVPYPKLDETQKEYRSLVHDATMLMVIPTTVSDTEMTGACLEALSSETYRYVIPAWYETALKIKYTRDNMSAMMIDLIHDSMTTNFIYVYNYALNNIGLLYRDLVTNKKTDYASKVAKSEKQATRKLEALMETFSVTINN